MAKDREMTTTGFTVEEMRDFATKYPWFDAARRATERYDALPAHIILMDSIRPRHAAITEAAQAHSDGQTETVVKKETSEASAKAATGKKSPDKKNPKAASPTSAKKKENSTPAKTEGEKSAKAERTTKPEGDKTGKSAKATNKKESAKQTKTVAAGKGEGASKSGDAKQQSGKNTKTADGKATDKTAGKAPEKKAPNKRSNKDKNSAASTIDIIDEFIDKGEHKVVPKDDTPDYIASGTVSEIPMDDELITEELAQIYMDQELFDQAKAIYERLSLLYPKKSVYFAEIIGKIPTA